MAVPSQTVAGHSGSDESRVLPLRSRVSHHRGSLEGDSNETRCPSSAPSQYPVLQRYRKEREGSLMGSNSKPSRNSIESFHNPAFQMTQRKKSAVTSDLGAIRAKV